MQGEVQYSMGSYEPREWFGRCDWCCEEHLLVVRLLAFDLCRGCAPAMEEHEERYCFVDHCNRKRWWLVLWPLRAPKHEECTVTVIRSRRPSTADFMKWLARRKQLLLAGWRHDTPTPTPAERGF